MKKSTKKAAIRLIFYAGGVCFLELLPRVFCKLSTWPVSSPASFLKVMDILVKFYIVSFQHIK